MRLTKENLKNGGDELVNELVGHLEKNGPKCEMLPVEENLRRGERIDRLHAEIDQLYAEVGRLKFENAKLRLKFDAGGNGSAS